MPLGDIGTVIDSYEFDPAEATNCHMIHIDGDVYAIAYRDAGGECRLKTVEIAANGQITDPYIDDLVVHTLYGMAPRIQWVSGTTYIIASRDYQFRPVMSTVQILPNGQIGDAVLDAWGYVTSSCSWHSWASATPTIVALAFQGAQDDGFIYSIEIDLEGNITKAALDSWEFDISYAQPGHIAQVHAGVFAISYHGPAAAGWIKTFSLDALGDLGTPPIDSLQFDTTQGAGPWLTQVYEAIYAIPYQGPLNHGKICTVSIADDGEIGDTIIDSMEFDTAFCGKPTSVSCGGNILAVAYEGPDLDGWLKTIEIAANGQITDTPLASFEFDEGNGAQPSIIRITGNVYAIAYTGVDDDGWLKTITIESPSEERADHGPMMGIGP